MLELAIIRRTDDTTEVLLVADLAAELDAAFAELAPAVMSRARGRDLTIDALQLAAERLKARTVTL